jgi:carboxypeptidase family protein
MLAAREGAGYPPTDRDPPPARVTTGGNRSCDFRGITDGEEPPELVVKRMRARPETPDRGDLGPRAIAGPLLAVLVAATALVALLVRRESSGSRVPPPESRQTSPAEGPLREATPSPKEVPGEGSAERSPLEPEEAVLVRGRVVLRGSAEPVPDAIVTILTGIEAIDFPETTAQLGGPEVAANLRAWWLHEDRLAEIGGWKPVHTARTTPEGSFAIGVPRDLPSFRFEVDAREAVYEGGSRRFSLASAEVEAGVQLEAERAGSIEGTLRGPDGEPAPSGRVALLHGLLRETHRYRRANGNANGEFAFRGVRPGTWGIAARAEGCAPFQREGVEVRAGEVTRVDLVLPVESAISGLVVDERGAGIPGVQVNLTRSSPSALAHGPLVGFGARSALTGPDGRFRFGSLEAAEYDLRAYLRSALTEGASLRAALPPGDGVHDLRLVVPGLGGALAGRVLDASGRPVGGVRVRARNYGIAGAPARPTPPARIVRRETSTGPDGRFVVVGLGRQAYSLEASAPGRGGVLLEPLRDDVGNLEVVLPGPTGIAGVVRAERSGSPMPRFRVDLRRTAVAGVPVGRSYEGVDQRWFNDLDGRFEMSDLSPALYAVRFVADGYQDADMSFEVKAGDLRSGLEVLLRPAPLVRGRVVAKETGAPVAGALVERLYFPEEEGARARTGEDGRFEIRSLGRAGRSAVQLGIRHPDFAPTAAPTVHVEEETSTPEVVVELAKGGGIEGLVRGRDGRILPGARVRSVAADGSIRAASEVPAREDGSFRIERLVPGRHEVGAILPGGKDRDDRAFRTTVAVEEGRVVRIEFPVPEAEAGCTLRGSVTRGDEEIVGARLMLLLHPAGESPPLLGATGSRGRFVLKGVRPGPATLAVEPPRPDWGSVGIASASLRIEVPLAPEHVVAVRMPAGEIRGRVRRKSDGVPLSRISVRLAQTDRSAPEVWTEVPAAASTDDDGGYRFVGLAPGEYVVRASGEWGGLEAEGVSDWPAPGSAGPVSVTEGAPVVADLDLESGGTAVVEVRDAAGNPLPGAKVELIPEKAPSQTNHRENRTWQADAAGTAVFRGLRPGAYRARVEGWSAGARRVGTSPPLAVESGGRTEFEVTVP